MDGATDTSQNSGSGPLGDDNPVAEALAPVAVSEFRRRGIWNPSPGGQFCWMNSIAQFLYMIEPLRHAIMLFNEFNGDPGLDLFRREMIRELGKMFKALEVASHDLIDPRPLVQCIIALHTALGQQKLLPGQIWTGSRPEDVYEFIVWLLEHLELVGNGELNRVLSTLN